MKREDVSKIFEGATKEQIDQILNMLSSTTGTTVLLGGGKLCIACYDGERLCGVAICTRPVARALDDGLTLEVSRLCTDGTANACSMLYGACARTAKSMGYHKCITYILSEENGTSLKASGWICDKEECGGGSWCRPSRPRTDKAPTCKKKRFIKILRG